MKHILLVVSSDVVARETGQRCMRRIALSQEYTSSGAKDSTFVQIVTTAAQVEELSDSSHSINDWLSLEETISLLKRIAKQENVKECSVGSAMENVARALHDAADSLPYLGSCVDIILCLGSSQTLAADTDSVIPVAGALRRLTEWHNGRAVIVKLRHELSSLEHQLTGLVHCQVINSVDELNLDWPVWRGKVAVMDHIENKGHLFPGCWLDKLEWDALVQQKLMSTDRHSVGLVRRTRVHIVCVSSDLPEAGMSSQTAVCGRNVEVLQEVDLRTFPLCLLDSWSLHLNAAEQHSDILVKYIQDLQTSGLLARVRVYLDINKIPLCGGMKLSTAAWKERVISEVENLQEPPEEQVADDWLYLYLLLLPSPGGSSVMAQVLLSPHEINSSILPLVEDQILVQKSVTKRNHHRCRSEILPCDELVLDQTDTFVMMLNILKENLQRVLSHYQDDVSKGGNAYEKMVGVAADVQGQILSAAFHECKSVQELLQGGTGYHFRWFTGSALDPSKFPEKLTIQATEASRKTLQSFPSMDSLTTSSPLSVTEVDKKKDSVDFDVYDVLQHFNQDGSLKEMSACPAKSAKLKGRGLCRLDRRCTTNLQWPESMLLKCHDIFYYNSEINWSLEKRYSKVRDRGYFQDTCSSFVSPIKKAQQTHSMLRRSASAQSPPTDSRPERPRRISPKKTSMADIFKQPASHLCSPRKQSQGTLKSATPELPLFGVTKSLEQLSSNSGAHSADLPNRSRDSFGRNRARNQTISSAMDISHQSPRKRTWTPGVACKQDMKSSSHDVEDLCPVRRSPRRSARPLSFSLESSVNGSIVETAEPSQGQFGEVRNSSFEQQIKEPSVRNRASDQASAKMKRSDRHKLKLQRIIDHVLREKGVEEKDRIFAACSRNLFNVSMVLLKTLTSSQNLTEEMKTVVYGQVTQIINLEKRRCGMAL